ncbi:hypothetical protein [Arthrobacter sp. PAMC25564]|uniref:hypothetical protein n=1 Tax=Arthrobacter sp. PAMC25564 TaxID=2565366 RepID=UPI001F110930|nr:hypothetical protein [Arthrobacter sp. PAMC25564]
MAPEAAQDSGTEPQAYPQGQAAGGAPQPGELIDVDLPGGSQEEQKNDDEGGLGGLPGGLFGKK